MSWDIRLIHSLFCTEDSSKILSIRPSLMNGEDIIRWKFGSRGIYTVKTGYHVQRTLDREEQQDQSSINTSTQVRNGMLTKLWKINAIPKVKIFWWKILHNGLPVADNLSKRGCKIDTLCQICGEEIETIDHMLLQCRVTWEIWTMALSDISIHLNRSSTVYDLFSYILNTGAEDQKNILPLMLSWRIWKMRNKLLPLCSPKFCSCS
ncbi:hypothetical protein Bca52824_091143 [Brassica carinata]|uniref:Reverse transcriptase zinc-binding domain-containing protein n=1 Tax=Brassica carinata TaxID=52824 RepID=A0A8X7NXD8_BRACI|nr:hypothetical protein Bca52824_091143 [Brassica carinata]